jgi:hypothetical protein
LNRLDQDDWMTQASARTIDRMTVVAIAIVAIERITWGGRPNKVGGWRWEFRTRALQRSAMSLEDDTQHLKLLSVVDGQSGRDHRRQSKERTEIAL